LPSSLTLSPPSFASSPFTPPRFSSIRYPHPQVPNVVVHSRLRPENMGIAHLASYSHPQWPPAIFPSNHSSPSGSHFIPWPTPTPIARNMPTQFTVDFVHNPPIVPSQARDQDKT
jgi:hypothetical protein